MLRHKHNVLEESAAVICVQNSTQTTHLHNWWRHSFICLDALLCSPAHFSTYFFLFFRNWMEKKYMRTNTLNTDKCESSNSRSSMSTVQSKCWGLKNDNDDDEPNTVKYAWVDSRTRYPLVAVVPTVIVAIDNICCLCLETVFVFFLHSRRQKRKRKLIRGSPSLSPCILNSRWNNKKINKLTHNNTQHKQPLFMLKQHSALRIGQVARVNVQWQCRPLHFLCTQHSRLICKHFA